MTCRKALSLFTPFINDQLNVKELEEFIDHVENCPDCREELEVTYILLTAMKQLEEDKQLSDDYSQDLATKLERAQEKIVHVKFAFFRKKGILILVILLLAVIIGVRYGYIKHEDNNNITKSNFRMRVMFDEERYMIYDKELQLYLERQGTMNK